VVQRPSKIPPVKRIKKRHRAKRILQKESFPPAKKEKIPSCQSPVLVNSEGSPECFQKNSGKKKCRAKQKKGNENGLKEKQKRLTLTIKPILGKENIKKKSWLRTRKRRSTKKNKSMKGYKELV